VVDQGRGPGQRTDPSRRPTKAERKEQARVERDQIQRTMAARRRNRRLALVLFAAATAIVVAVVFLLQPESTAPPGPAELLAQASAQASTAGCGSVQQTSDYPGGADLDRMHIGADSQVSTPPPLSSYASTPPASGPHDGNPMPAGIYSSPPDVYRTIHSLEHAGAIIWYAPSAADSEAVRQIKDFYSQSDNVGQAKVIVAPYDFASQGAAGTLPGGIQMALVAWHRLEICAQANLAAAYSFTSQYSDATPGGQYVGIAPEPGGAM
jgi:hypothetical protein